jgi:hypothetical protein
MHALPPPAESGSGSEDPVPGLLAAENIEVAKRVSAPLLQTAVAAKAAKDPRLASAFRVWWNRANDATEPSRVEALALIWRLTSLSAMSLHRRQLSALISGGIAPGLRPLSDLDDPKDRRAAAEALAAASAEPWLAEYAADAMVADPDPKSDARDALASVLLRQSGSVAKAFGLLAQAFSEVRIQQQDPAAGRARRTAWVLRSLRTPLYQEELLEGGAEFGDDFSRFVSLALGSAQTSDRAALVEAVREIFLTLNTIVRLHGLTIATDARTYAAVDILRRRFQATDWPEDVADPVAKLAHRVAEALFVLARQGIADAGLRRAYLTMLGTVVATARLKRLVVEAEGLESDIAYWLETGTARERMESAGAIEETATALVDLELARALRELSMLDAQGEAAGDPSSRYRQIGRELREAARKRGLATRGVPGDVIDFSPLEHEADAGVIGHRKVRLLTPLVERIAGGRSVAILVKAQVEALGEG